MEPNCGSPFSLGMSGTNSSKGGSDVNGFQVDITPIIYLKTLQNFVMDIGGIVATQVSDDPHPRLESDIHADLNNCLRQAIDRMNELLSCKDAWSAN